jgi:hypothetical protein
VRKSSPCRASALRNWARVISAWLSGYLTVPRDPYPPEMREARERVFAACRKHRVAFLQTAAPETIVGKLDEGVRVIAGHREETAILGRAHQKRTIPTPGAITLDPKRRAYYCASCTGIHGDDFPNRRTSAK